MAGNNSDGSITIDTELDNDGFEKGSKKLLSSMDSLINRIDHIFELTFIDDGIQFDPLAKENEIISDSLNRSEAGMGLYILERKMDSLDYQYLNGKNVFTIRKHI